MKFQLRAADLFDRDAPVTRELDTDDPLVALRALWSKTLREGVLEDGRETFTSFTLAGPASMGLCLTRAKNPELAAIRGVMTQDLLTALATEHARRLAEPFAFGPYLALAHVVPAEWTRVTDVLAAALGLGGVLQLDVRSTWVRGPRDGVRLRVEPGVPGRCVVRLEGQAGVRFALELELDPVLSQWRYRLDADDTTATKTLADALLATNSLS